jgi:uncharacterized protein
LRGQEATDHEVPRRPLGKTGVEVSVIGVGGAHLGLPRVEERLAVRIVREAIDAGVDFLDNNWGYHAGVSEERMGKALRNGYRERAFLMTKVDARDREGALRQLDESLRRLGTDYLDLWQLHEIVFTTDPDMVSAPGGALEALDEARRQGKTRFVGFTGHKDPALHLRMLDLYAFDTVQLPLNLLDHHFRSFERQVLPRLVDSGMGAIGMKSFAEGAIPRNGLASPEEALGYVLNLPVSTVVKGFESLEELHEAIDIAANFAPFEEHKLARLRRRTRPDDVSGDGRHELYKTSMFYDSDATRAQHGFPLSSELPL